ncbi:MAG: threonine--tRNA ligase, partial [Chlamydiota bacterium]|nr:threonine--tRNA ligase [Chlamydiota bacterium]
MTIHQVAPLRTLVPSDALSLLIEGKVVDADTLLKGDEEIIPLTFESKRGKALFWHTSAHLLAQAVKRLYPEALPTIGPAIEEGFYYDFANLSLSIDDLPAIEKEMKKIASKKFTVERLLFSSRKEALDAFHDNPYKQEIIASIPEGEALTAYRQKEFVDLCRGPHLPHLGKISSLKLLKVSGAYWRGDAGKAMLTRIYGISFPSKGELKQYLWRVEEAERRDHRKIGKQLNLFSFHEEAPSMPLFHPHGMALWHAIVEYWKEEHMAAGYQLIQTPQLMAKELWEKSGHWEHYRENMFTVPLDEERKAAIKPMNCPGCMLYYKTEHHSYREFPLKVGEIGHVHRREPSGALSGLFRIQSFHQDDAHLFLTADLLPQAIEEILTLVSKIYATFGLQFSLELSTRPEKAIGNAATWEKTTQALREALDRWGAPYALNEGDGAFYGPKIDCHVHDAVGRKWQCGTIQLDFSLPERFRLQYKDQEGEMKTPLMIHRALYGSIERFLAILIEHFAGKFPLWMQPEQIRLLPVAASHLPLARHLLEKLRKEGFRASLDAPSESIGKRVRKGQMEKINYLLTLGDRESERGEV